MSRIRFLVTALLLAAGGTFAAPAALAAPVTRAAADTAPPVLKDVTFSSDAVSVSGVNLVPVTVSVRLTDESGVVVSYQNYGEKFPYVVLVKETDGKTSTQAVELALTDGTAQDGVWGATVQVPSTWDGRWEVSKVIADDAQRNRLDVDPRSSGITATLDVDGSHQPAVTMEFSPDPAVGGGPLTVRGRFYDTETGKGLPNQPMFFGVDNLCVEHGGATNGRTAADGTFSRTYETGWEWLHCVGIPRPSNVEAGNSYIVVTSGHPRIRPGVTVQASSTTVAPGSKVTFTGTVAPAGANSVHLQELRAGTWHKVAGTRSDDKGRFTLATKPSGVGSHSYRVTVPKAEADLTGVSETIVVQVGAGGSGGGELPITGAAALPLVGGALALILVGAGLTVAGRRRRVRVVADS